MKAKVNFSQSTKELSVTLSVSERGSRAFVFAGNSMIIFNVRTSRSTYSYVRKKRPSLLN